MEKLESIYNHAATTITIAKSFSDSTVTVEIVIKSQISSAKIKKLLSATMCKRELVNVGIII